MSSNNKLIRSKEDQVIAGVCAGLAKIMDLDVSIVRVIFALIAVFSGGTIIIVYIVLAIVVPLEETVSNTKKTNYSNEDDLVMKSKKMKKDNKFDEYTIDEDEYKIDEDDYNI